MVAAKNGDGGVTFVLGGARSGKSQYAERFVTALPEPWVYIATAEARDEEMAARIAEHRARRAAGWQNIEAPHELPQALDATPRHAAVLVDCLTLWLSNVMHAKFHIDKITLRLEEALARRDGPTVIVSNELGLGLVPDTAIGRSFRDAQGVLNQRIAASAGRVVFMVAGQPLVVKGTL